MGSGGPAGPVGKGNSLPLGQYIGLPSPASTTPASTLAGVSSKPGVPRTFCMACKCYNPCPTTPAGKAESQRAPAGGSQGLLCSEKCLEIAAACQGEASQAIFSSAPLPDIPGFVTLTASVSMSPSRAGHGTSSICRTRSIIPSPGTSGCKNYSKGFRVSSVPINLLPIQGLGALILNSTGSS